MFWGDGPFLKYRPALYEGLFCATKKGNFTNKDSHKMCCSSCGYSSSSLQHFCGCNAQKEWRDNLLTTTKVVINRPILGACVQPIRFTHLSLVDLILMEIVNFHNMEEGIFTSQNLADDHLQSSLKLSFQNN